MKTSILLLSTVLFLVSCSSQPIGATGVPPDHVTAESPSTEVRLISPPSSKIPTKVIGPIDEPTGETIASLAAERKPTDPASQSGEEPTEEPTNEPTSPAIDYFAASPMLLYGGDSTELSWNASGESAEICPISSFEYFTPEDCRQVSLSGSLQFTIPEDLQPFYSPGFRLEVHGEAGSGSQQAYAYVNLYCPNDWFFDRERAAGPVFPQESVSSWTAIQNFEHGTMIWIESLGRYYISSPQSFDQSPLSQHQQFHQIDDPLSLTGDTSSEYAPPDGLFSPERGFGIVWRGDVADRSPLLEVLGWALAPEYGYRALFQCTEFYSTQFGTTCYLAGPYGELIWIETHYQRWQRLR
jgi:hypothetical protein